MTTTLFLLLPVPSLGGSQALLPEDCTSPTGPSSYLQVTEVPGGHRDQGHLEKLYRPCLGCWPGSDPVAPAT